VAGSGCFKNLEEWMIVLFETIKQPTKKEFMVLWPVLGSCDVFENRSYISKLIL
jgi:hypothetical protein